ncbi:thiamine phosphate synthase [soil metagenome]
MRDLPPLLFFTDPARTPEPWATAERLPAGAGVVYRHFGAGNAEAVAWRLREITSARGVRLLIGLDAALAIKVEADGVHLPERAMAEAAALRAAHPAWLLTGALHHPARSNLSVQALDALVLSPIFPAGGGSAVKTALGADALAVAKRVTGQPIYALGGITPGTVAALEGSGACGIASVDAIRQAFA